MLDLLADIVLGIAGLAVLAWLLFGDWIVANDDDQEATGDYDVTNLD